MRILGIDPGSRRTGWAVVEKRASRLYPVGFGTLVLGDGPFAPRLLRLFQELSRLVEQHGPAAVSVEGVFHARNADSALKLGHARGVALLVAALHRLEVFEYPPAVVKQAVTSSGRADKDQVQRMVTLLLGLEAVPAPDAADALAVAICHAHSCDVLIALRAK